MTSYTVFKIDRGMCCVHTLRARVLPAASTRARFYLFILQKMYFLFFCDSKKKNKLSEPIDVIRLDTGTNSCWPLHDLDGQTRHLSAVLDESFIIISSSAINTPRYKGQ